MDIKQWEFRTDGSVVLHYLDGTGDTLLVVRQDTRYPEEYHMDILKNRLSTYAKYIIYTSNNRWTFKPEFIESMSLLLDLKVVKMNIFT